MKVQISFPQIVVSWNKTDGELKDVTCWPVSSENISVGPYMCDTLEAHP